ncbi:hypothetical protein H4R20_001602 [Coemansia guatemalensis]|uniref:HpcH/HpaI aldolase/citrate lyase domain-containing protein n=1 Tax=Coemansia guatemalensis TaxID=2761395 RepID=A0A9W8I428_9FUNG|nr:hypothetical protein H4R20_001602 [Coemansia guatemalensis]
MTISANARADADALNAADVFAVIPVILCSIISESVSPSINRANSASPRARSRSRLRSATSSSSSATAGTVTATVLPPISTVTGAEYVKPIRPVPPMHTLQAPTPAFPTLRAPYSQVRPVSNANGTQLARLHSPQQRPAAPVDLAPLSRRPHPYHSYDVNRVHSYSNSAVQPRTQQYSTPVLSPPRINTPPQQGQQHQHQQHQRPFLAPLLPQQPHNLRSSPMAASISSGSNNNNSGGKNNNSNNSGSSRGEIVDSIEYMDVSRGMAAALPETTASNACGLRHKLHSGRSPTYGIVLGIASLVTARVASGLGFDWACVDMEHSPQSATIMAEMVAAIGSSGKCAPLVRVPSHTNEWIRWAVEAGAHGIIIPGVQNREQMWRLVSACRNAASQSSSASSAPVSNTAHGTAQRTHAHPHAATPPASAMSQALSTAGSDVLVIPQIDSLEAANNIEEILSVPGVDAAFVQPQGLYAHGGRMSPSATGHAQVIPAETLDRMLRSSHRLALPLGIDSADGAAARVGAQQGFRMVAVGNDVDVLARAAAEQLRMAQMA